MFPLSHMLEAFIRVGTLKVIDAEGKSHVFAGAPGPQVTMRLTDPTLYRNVTLPIVTTVLEKLKEPKLANALGKLGTIFGSYGEWGQPIHDVGNDVRILGLPIRRPDTQHAFRMLCRHNRYVQEYGRVRDPDEVARRERLWDAAIEKIEFETGREAASLEAAEFRDRLADQIDPGTFRAR